MKINPLDLVLNNKLKIDKNFYFITGNELTYIEKIKEIIINTYNENKDTKIEKINNLNSYSNSISLFESKKIYVVSSIEKIDEGVINKLDIKDEIFIFSLENSPKTRIIKKKFINRKDSCLIECYELTKEEKIKILNNWLNKIGITLENETYWFLVEKLDNRYVFLESELKKLEEINKKNLNLEDVNKIIFKNTKGLEKIFFHVLNKNDKLINIYNEKINDKKEVNEFYYSFKQFCMLILSHNTEIEFSKNIPSYLFRQKNYLIEIYKKYNLSKRKLLISLLEETEKMLRKQDSLSLSIGLRFLLKFKKLTIS